ncbi:hypothetical protein DIPPA_23913 [Diplonema papillatum]|nr:hypothetical protein DIPPA_23913 [Diplonema papillatum]
MDEPDEMTPAHPAFWDHFYESGEGSNGTYEWFMDWGGYADFVHAVEKRPEMRMLHIGCGNSTFSDRMKETWAERFDGHLLNIDVCEAIVDQMRQDESSAKRPKAKPKAKKGGPAVAQRGRLHCDYRAMDCCSLDLPDHSIDFVFDKGTVDALLSQCDDQTMAEGNNNVFKYFREAHRVLKPEGTFMLITINAPDVIYPYALGADDNSDDAPFIWTVTTHTIDKGNTKASASTVHSHGGFNSVYILKKPAEP